MLLAHYTAAPTVWSYDLGMIDICLYYRIIKDNLRAIDIKILEKIKDIWYQEITGVLIKQTGCNSLIPLSHGVPTNEILN